MIGPADFLQPYIIYYIWKHKNFYKALKINFMPKYCTQDFKVRLSIHKIHQSVTLSLSTRLWNYLRDAL